MTIEIGLFVEHCMMELVLVVSKRMKMERKTKKEGT